MLTDNTEWRFIEFYGKVNEIFTGKDDKGHFHGAFKSQIIPGSGSQWTYYNNYTVLKHNDMVHNWLRAFAMNDSFYDSRCG